MRYRDLLGAQVSAPLPLPEHGVTTVFVNLPNTKIELLHPLGENSPIRKFLESNPAGAIHHLCYEVDDILAARDRLKAAGARVLGNGAIAIAPKYQLVQKSTSRSGAGASVIR